jgi:hypothetical protein
MIRDFDNISAMRKSYDEKGFALAQNMFPKEVMDGFLTVVQQQYGGTPETFGTTFAQSSFTEMKAFEFYAFDFKPALTFLWGLTPFMRAVTGVDLLPTHSYFRVYQKGDMCKVHTDRYSCEHSLTLTLDYADDFFWPLWVGGEHFEVKEGDPYPAENLPSNTKLSFAKVSMRPGDAVLYKGVNRLHGREDPNPNRWSAHIFLHWIDRDGPFRHFAFDQHEEEYAKKAEFDFSGS